MENGITVVILNWKRPQNIVNHILPSLEKLSLIKEIIISHGRQDTAFRYTLPPYHVRHDDLRIEHRDDSKNNAVFGLALRFLTASHASYPHVLFVDDDTVPHPAGVYNMYQMYIKKQPCIVAKYGRRITRDITYSTRPPIEQEQGRSGYIQVPIALTSCTLVPRTLCCAFLHTFQDSLEFVFRKSRPLWNGEDIALSILSLIQFRKPIIVMTDNEKVPVKQLDTQQDTDVAIHKMRGHQEYRTAWLRHLLEKWRISHSLLFPRRFG